MARHIWTVLCGKSSTDSVTNNISLFEVIEQLNIKRPAGQAGQTGLAAVSLELISLWTRSQLDVAERVTARLVHCETDGSEIAHIEFEVNLSQKRRMRTISKIEGLPIRQTGEQSFRVDLRTGETWERVASLPVEVVISNTPEGA